LSDQDVVNLFRDTADIWERVAQECKKLLHRDGRPRVRFEEKVITWDISVIRMVYYKIMSGLSQKNERNITKYEWIITKL
jgi:hypothetical protein